jgi:hypothetical protein
LRRKRAQASTGGFTSNKHNPTNRDRRRKKDRAPPATIPERLLYPRAEAAVLLGVNTQTLSRLEQQGCLTPVRLNSAPGARSGKVLYARSELLQLVQARTASNEATDTA